MADRPLHLLEESCQLVILLSVGRLVMLLKALEVKENALAVYEHTLESLAALKKLDRKNLRMDCESRCVTSSLIGR